MVAHGHRHRQAGPPQGLKDLTVEAGPHGLEPLAAQTPLLPRDHVPAAEDQIRLPLRDEADGTGHLGLVAGGAVGGIEVADRHQPQVATERGAQPPGPDAGRFRPAHGTRPARQGHRPPRPPAPGPRE